jgi:acid phosphatase family membrane protein YuiD
VTSLFEKRLKHRFFKDAGTLSHILPVLKTAAASVEPIPVVTKSSFAIVVMFDAQGVRRASGKQARILNKIMDDIYWQGKITEGRLRELIGLHP